jgi:hypothetical protein
MEYHVMLSGPATRINTAALDLEFAERHWRSAHKLFRQDTRSIQMFQGSAARNHTVPNQMHSKSEAQSDSINLRRAAHACRGERLEA